MTCNMTSASNWKQRFTQPAALLGAGVLLSIGLMLIPDRWIEPVRGWAQTALRPGQAGVQELRRRGGSILATLKSQSDLATRLGRSEADRERLEKENYRLAAELAESRSRAAGQANNAPDRLLTSQCVPARTLGQQARAFLTRRHILDAGSQAGVEPDALVIDPRPALLDRGSDAQLRAGQMVISQGRVWGKIAAVGPLTSTVQCVTEAGYRDLVAIGKPHADEASHTRPQGILEGTGEPLARIRLVEVTQPVTVGDLVYSASATDLTPEPLLYGRVARVERPVGAAHWKIWMEPTISSGRPDRVVVLQAELNPARVAGAARPRNTD